MLTVGMLALTLAITRGTALGLMIEASGGNPRASALSGVGTQLITLAVYIWSGLCAALAGIVAAASSERSSSRR
jgi:simple sugar transport system permease protein